MLHRRSLLDRKKKTISKSISHEAAATETVKMMYELREALT